MGVSIGNFLEEVTLKSSQFLGCSDCDTPFVVRLELTDWEYVVRKFPSLPLISLRFLFRYIRVSRIKIVVKFNRARIFIVFNSFFG